MSRSEQAGKSFPVGATVADGGVNFSLFSRTAKGVELLFFDKEHERQRVSLNALLRQAKQAWHGTKLNQPDWGDGSHSVALGGELRDEGLFFHFIINAFWEPLNFEMPKQPAANSWRRWIDTSLDSPDDIVPWEKAPSIPGNMYRVADRSVVMLYTSSKV